MTESSGRSLTDIFEGLEGYFPRTFTRKDTVFINRSSPREPYLSFTTGFRPLRGLVIKVWSCDQVDCDAQNKTDKPNANSHTWLAMGILPKASGPACPPEEPFFWEFKRNFRASTEKTCHIFEWIVDNELGGDRSDVKETPEWWKSISSGSSVEVGVFPLAESTGWVNVVHQIDVHLYDESNVAFLIAGLEVLTTDASQETTSQIIKSTDTGTKSKPFLTRQMQEALMDQSFTSNPEIGAKLNNVAIGRGGVYEHQPSIEELKGAMEMSQRFIEALPDSHPMRATFLNNLGALLAMSYEATQSMDDLTKAIEVAHKAVHITPKDHPYLGTRLNNLENWLDKRFKRTQSIHDLRKATQVREQAVKVTPAGHPTIIQNLNGLAAELRSGDMQTRSVEDLETAIEISKKAARTASDDDPELPKILNDLGNSHGARYNATGQISDLLSAIELLDKVVRMVPRRHPRLPEYLNNLGIWLRVRFGVTGSLDHLERAIEVTQKAVETPDADEEDLPTYLSNLGFYLWLRSRLTNSTSDLDRGIEIIERALAIVPESHPEVGRIRGKLGICLAYKSDLVGSKNTLGCLTRTIELRQQATEVTGENHPNFAIHSSSLGQALKHRFELTMSVGDLTRAMEATRKAIVATPIGHPNLPTYLGQLASYAGKRYTLFGRPSDIAGAIEAAEKAVEWTPQDHKTLSGKLNILSYQLSLRYRRTGKLQDITRAIEVSKQAVLAANPGTRASCWFHLGQRLHEQFGRTGSMDDLVHAIEAAKKAVEATPASDTRLAMRLQHLGNKLGCQYEQTCVKADQDAQLSTLVRAFHCTMSPPSDRIRSVKPAADVYASRAEWYNAYDLLRQAVLLLPKVSPRSLKQSEMQHFLRPTSGLATDAAATALNAGKPVSEVLSILELGRGVIAGLLIQTRGDLSSLREIRPSLADKFDALRKELDSPSQDSGSMAELPTTNRRHQVSRELDEVIEQIRFQDGFHDFLQPPPAGSLMAAAASGPVVVINVSSYRCDAILVECHTVRLLELPGLELKEVENYARDIRHSKHTPWRHLEWLWTTVCKPCLDALGFTEPSVDGQWPHIWWLPTGPLSQLPLHAAGIYTPESKETVLDRVVSSYASSFKALQHGRRGRTGMSDGHAAQNDAVLVAMEQTKGQASLLYARKEIDKIRALCPSLRLNAITPPRRKADVLEHLETCKILHFAGHGESRPDPSQSRVLLDDWEVNPLTVSDLRESWLQQSPAFLAYLSACSTGSDQGWGLEDEAIHLVSAFQLAGFRHVIGTLWEVSDPHCVDVATVLYETLCEQGMTDEAVSYGLHRAVRKLRDDCFREGGKRDIFLVGEDDEPTSGSSVNTFWIPYIHFGA